jgi:hypothetical protein
MHFSYFKENDCYKMRSYELATLFVTWVMLRFISWSYDVLMNIRFHYKLGQAGSYSSCYTVMWMYELHYRKLGIMEDAHIFHMH